MSLTIDLISDHAAKRYWPKFRSELVKSYLNYIDFRITIHCQFTLYVCN